MNYDEDNTMPWDRTEAPEAEEDLEPRQCIYCGHPIPADEPQTVDFCSAQCWINAGGELED